jgi:hypothetical protein
MLTPFLDKETKVLNELVTCPQSCSSVESRILTWVCGALREGSS